jgi:hypothetical protein
MPFLGFCARYPLQHGQHLKKGNWLFTKKGMTVSLLEGSDLPFSSP